MCGIVGFTGNRQAAPILLDGLSKLEYRGYDSAGLAVRDGEALAQVVKAKGRADPKRTLRKDYQQYVGVQEPWCLSDGAHYLWQV